MSINKHISRSSHRQPTLNGLQRWKQRPDRETTDVFSRISHRAKDVLTSDTALGIYGVLGFVFIWDLVLRIGWVSSISIPYPRAVLSAAFELAIDRDFHPHLIDTIRTWGIAIAFCALIVIPIGLLIGRISWLDRPTSTLIHGARSVPGTALIPVAILLFGLEFQMKFSVVVYAITWPLVINTIYGARDVDKQMFAVAHSLNWSESKIFRRLILPSAAPYVATGLRIAAAVGLVVTIATELLGARYGIGTVMVRYGQSRRPDFVYATILYMGLLGTLIYYAFLRLEDKYLPWASAGK